MSTSSGSALPFGLSKIIRPTSTPLAKTRLKSNLFILFLFTFGKNFFSPYITIRSAIVELSDIYLQGRRTIRRGPGGVGGVGGVGSWADNVFYLVEFLITSILIWNIIEAVISIQYPQTYIPEIKRQNLILTPSKVSSPLTRSYSPSPSSSRTTTSSGSSSSQNSQSQSLQRSIYRSSPTSTPIRSHQQQSSSSNSNLNQSQTQQAHPLSNSTSNPSPSKTTAKLLNLPINDNSSPSKSGLFFEKKESQAQGQGGALGGDFVLVDREEKQWVDNVLKGVRGKGGKVNL